MKPTFRSLSISQAARLGTNNSFAYKVRKEIIRRLLEQGKLSGTFTEKVPCVIDDAAFRNLIQFGIEKFVYDRQGWSFTAVRATIENIARHLENRRGVVSYARRVELGKLSAGEGVEINSNKRHIFLVRTKGSSWTIIIQTVHWIQRCDMFIGLLLASELSAILKTEGIAAWDDNFSGATAVLCKHGTKATVLTDAEDWINFYSLFYTKKIFVPEGFIAVNDGKARLLVGEPDTIERCDHLLIGFETESTPYDGDSFLNLRVLASDSGGNIGTSSQPNLTLATWKQVEAQLQKRTE